MQIEHLLALLVVALLFLVLVLWWVVDELKKLRGSRIQPILQLYRTPEGVWWVENIGTGSAINIALLFKERRGQWFWQQPIALPAMAPGARSPLPVDSIDRWAMAGLRYQDLERRVFSTAFNCLTQVFAYRRRWLYSRQSPVGFPTIK